MSEQRQTWIVRVAQEYTIPAATVAEAYAFMQKAEKRKIKGAALIEGTAVGAPAGREESA